MKAKKQKNNPILVLTIIVALVVLFLLWLMKSGYSLPKETGTFPAIENTKDLDATSKDLDGTNLNEMDSGIKQVSSDSSSF